MRTPEILLTPQQLFAAASTLQAMQDITDRGHDWEHVNVFTANCEGDDDGHFIGDVIYLVKGDRKEVVLRIEYFES
ncbi:hypothetical protein [Hymenobacter siberiensis]|uniref:hypothetical protein n=1 Tax=Hymenobacter siberiensis TaxID=2848396 RepID=UPI001C1E5403|nr:hypothetical protein [Hymenobacter siberiensis]